MAKQTKLHELLAVRGELATQAAKVRGELASTIEKKRHLFTQKRVVFTPSEENAQPQTEEQSDIQSSVGKELDWISPFLSKAIDASYQVDEANTEARADIVLEDDSILLKGVPGTTLLELEKRVTEIHNLIDKIPTLDPAKGFKLDSQSGYYQAREINKSRTKKIKDVLIKYAATKEHPAQTEVIDKDVVVGKITENEWSAMLTPAEKAEVLARVEMLSRAVRAARSRANDAIVNTDKKIGQTLLRFVFQGKATIPPHLS